MGNCFGGFCHYLPKSAYITNMYEKSFATKTSGGKKIITVNIMNANRQFVPIEVVFDTGNDITLLTKATAQRLGLYNPNVGSSINVGGINGQPREFRMLTNYIQFGKMKPQPVRMAFAVNAEDLPVNLLGNKDILDSGAYDVVMDANSLEIREKPKFANGF